MKGQKNGSKQRRRPSNKPKREEPRKDSSTKRVNFDNTREDRFERDMREKKTSGSNDPAWYAQNAELMRSAASLPFSTTTGLPLPWNGQGVQTTVPGIMAISWAPSIGGQTIEPINAAANSMYSYVVHANSRNTRYGATDLMMVVVAGMNLFSAIAHAIRAYGTMRRFDQRNNYLPQGLIAAMGFNYQDLKSHLSEMWFDINEMVARATQIWIPKTMPLMDRWFWMNSNIYMDSESVKGQYYLYTPTAFYAYNEEYNDNGGALTWIPDDAKSETTMTPFSCDPDSNHTWAEYKAILNAMFDSLLQSEDRGIMYGDILKAYGSENLFAISPIPADYVVEPVYDREVLTQIENLSVYNLIPYAFAQNMNLNQIYVDWLGKDAKVQPTLGTQVMTEESCPLEAEVLNFHQVEVPTPAQVMVSTRLKTLGTSYYAIDANSGIFIPTTCGTETVKKVTSVYWNIKQGTYGLSYTKLQQRTTAYNLRDTSISQWVAFDWAPWLYRINSMPTSGQWPQFKPVTELALGDWDFYTTIDVQTLAKMHLTALYSEFGVPVL